MATPDPLLSFTTDCFQEVNLGDEASPPCYSGRFILRRNARRFGKHRTNAIPPRQSSSIFLFEFASLRRSRGVLTMILM